MCVELPEAISTSSMHSSWIPVELDEQSFHRCAWHRSQPGRVPVVGLGVAVLHRVEPRPSSGFAFAKRRPKNVAGTHTFDVVNKRLVLRLTVLKNHRSAITVLVLS